MNRQAITAAILLAGLALVLLSGWGEAAPTGASILSNETESSPSQSPGSRADERGTITILLLDALQQDQQWKAYVGNVSGRLSLDNADGFTIYDWELQDAIGGEVYVSRSNAVNFDNVSCANTGNITTEHPLYNMTDTQSDSITNTYNETSHQGFFVGTTSISSNSCPSTATFVNDTRQSLNGNQTWQALILMDDSFRLVYTTLLDDNEWGYDNETYDFQIIVPESDVNSTPTTYYFWTELDG